MTATISWLSLEEIEELAAGLSLLAEMVDERIYGFRKSMRMGPPDVIPWADDSFWDKIALLTDTAYSRAATIGSKCKAIAEGKP